MPYEPGQPYREEEHSNGHPPSGRDPGHLEEAAFDLFRRVLFPDSHEHHPGEHNTERLADLMRLLDTHGHSSDFRDVLKEVEFYHPGFLNKLKHGDAHDYVEGLYRRHTEEAFDPNEWELDHGGHEKGRVEEEDSHWNREGGQEVDAGWKSVEREEGDHQSMNDGGNHHWDHKAESSPWHHEDHPWDHQVADHPWDHRVEDHPWDHKAEDHRWDHKTEDHLWDRKTEDHRWDRKTEDHPWSHRAEDHPWDHQVEDHPLDHRAEDHPWDHRVEDHPWDHRVEDHPWDNRVEDHPWDRRAADYPWNHKADDHPWNHKTEDRPWYHGSEDHPSDHRAEDQYWSRELERHLWGSERDHQHRLPLVEEAPWKHDLEEHPWDHLSDPHWSHTVDDHPWDYTMEKRSVGVVEDEDKRGQMNSHPTAKDETSQRRNTDLVRSSPTIINSKRLVKTITYPDDTNKVNSGTFVVKQSTMVVFIAIVFAIIVVIRQVGLPKGFVAKKEESSRCGREPPKN